MASPQAARYKGVMFPPKERAIMSSRELEEIAEEAAERQLAIALCITIEQLRELEYSISTNESNDGLIYEYLVQFSEDSPKDILGQIEGLSATNCVRLQPSDLDADPYDSELLWDIHSSTQFDDLLENLHEVERILFTSKDEIAKSSLSIMLYAHVIAAFEAYLSSTFINLISNSKILTRRFVEGDAHFQKQKIAFSQLFREHDGINETVSDALKKRIFHRIGDTKKLYSSILDVEIGDAGWLSDAISVRHHCVHRAGRDLAGNKVSVENADIVRLVNQCIELARSINEQLLIHRL